MNLSELKVGDLVYMIKDCANDKYNGHVFRVVCTFEYEESSGDCDMEAEIITLNNKDRSLSEIDVFTINIPKAFRIIYDL